MTPVDWSAAFSLAAVKGTQPHSFPDLNILLLAVGLAHSSAGSVKYIRQFPNYHINPMPWIRVLSLELDDLGREKRELLSIIRHPGVPTIREAISGFNRVEIEQLEIIKRVWAASLTQPTEPGNNHAFSNLVGPQLIMGKGRESNVRLDGLRALMAAVEVMPGSG